MSISSRSSRAPSPSTIRRTSRHQLTAKRSHVSSPSISGFLLELCDERAAQLVHRALGLEDTLVERAPLGTPGAVGDEHAVGLEVPERGALLAAVGRERVRRASRSSELD